MIPKRYYFQYIHPDQNPFCQEKGWYVFDRDFTDPQGEMVPISFCWSRLHAKLIRDALNA